MLPLLLVLTLPATVQAQFIIETNNGTITITWYTGPGGDVEIPSTITGLPVTSIGAEAFKRCTSLTSITIPDSVTSIGDRAFGWCSNLTSVTSIGYRAFGKCSNLTNVTIPNSVASMGNGVFDGCSGLTIITIPNSITNIGDRAFQRCSNLARITVPNSVTSIGKCAFAWCASLTEVHFKGNAPHVAWDAFMDASNARIYYSPGTTGWGPTFGGRPTALGSPSPSPAK